MDMDFDQDWWDVKSVTKAAKLLSEVLPKIEAHWSKMLPTTGKLEGVEALRGLGSALERAIDYVEFPFGKYKKNQAKDPKEWHIPSVLIAKKVIIGLKEAGRTEPGTAKGSIVADVTHKALGHLGYTLDPSAVAKHITDWFSKRNHSAGDADSYWQDVRRVEQWVDDCRRSRGRILQGRYMHRCPKFGPMDETHAPNGPVAAHRMSCLGFRFREQSPHEKPRSRIILPRIEPPGGGGSSFVPTKPPFANRMFQPVEFTCPRMSGGRFVGPTNEQPQICG
jgi:hypothetical protein